MSQKTSHISYPGELPDLDHQTISLRAQLRLSYETYGWLRYLTWSSLILLAALLLFIPGGLPPRVAVLFWQTVPMLGQLLALHGPANESSGIMEGRVPGWRALHSHTSSTYLRQLRPILAEFWKRFTRLIQLPGKCLFFIAQRDLGKMWRQVLRQRLPVCTLTSKLWNFLLLRVKGLPLSFQPEISSWLWETLLTKGLLLRCFLLAPGDSPHS